MESIGNSPRLPVFPNQARKGLASLMELFDVQVVETPFVGLRPFELEDNALFFGRSEQTDELLQRLHRTRLVAVVGGSGCGKSSLVRAGLIPALQAGFLVADRDAWGTFMMKPGDQPLRNLAAALLAKEGRFDAVDELTEEIRKSRANAVLEHLQPWILNNNNVLVIVDQFEETFRFGLTGDEDRRDEAASFISILLGLTQKPGLPVYVVLTMRSDFMGDCDAFPGFAESMNRSIYLVPRLTRQQRREAIEGPIRMAGAAITPRLLDRLLDESDMASDQLPVLQHALMRTWGEWRQAGKALAEEQQHGGNGSLPQSGLGARSSRQPPISIEHYNRAGTLKDALNRHAEEALKGLDLDLTRKVFQALTDVDAANRQIRRPARMSVLEKVTGGSREVICEILERFQSDGRCFVVWTGDLKKDDPLIDLSHESLIRCWKTLAKWVEEEADSAAVYRRLESATARRQRGGNLWRDTDLQQALDWQETHEVGPDWAARVRPSEMFQRPSWKRPTFEQVIEFLKESRIARDEELEYEEAQKQELLLARERERQAQELARIREEKLVQEQELSSVREERLVQAEELTRVHQERLAQAQELMRAREETLAQAQELAESRRQWIRKLKAISTVAAGLALIAVGLTVYLQWTKSNLEVAKSELEDVVLSSRLTQQSKALAAANPQLGVLLAVEALALAPPDVWSAKEPENALRSALASIGGRGLGGHYGDVSSMAVTPDGRWLVSGGLDGTVRRWKLSDPRPEKTVEVIFGADGEGAEQRAAVHVATAPGKIAIGDAKGTVRLRGQDLPLKTGGAAISALAFDASGRWLVAGDEKGGVWLWSLAAGSARQARLEKLHEEPVVFAELSPDGRWLVTASTREVGDSEKSGESGDLMVLWQLGAGQAPRAVKVEQQQGVSTVDLSGDKLATGFRNGTVELWQLGTAGVEKVGKTRIVSASPGASERVPVSIGAIALSPDGKIVAAAEDGSISLWDGNVAVLMQEDRAQKNRDVVTHLAISPGGAWLVAYNGGSVRLRPLGGQKAEGDVLELRGHGGGVETIAFSPDRLGDLDSRWLFTGGSDGTVRRWDLAAPDPSSETVLYRGKWVGPRVIGLSPDRNWLIAGDEEKSELCYLGGKIREPLPDLAGAKISDDSRWLLMTRGNKPAERSFGLRRLIPGRESVLVEELQDASAAALASNPSDPNDTWLVTGQKDDGSVWIRRVRPDSLAETPQVVLPGGKEPVDQVVITPDRRYVLVARAQDAQGTVQIWRLRDRKMVFEEKKIGDPEIAVSPDSRWLAIADAANVTRVLDLEPPEPVRYEVKNNLNITAMALAPADRLILGFEDGTAQSYLLSDKAPAAERILDGHRGPIFSLTVSRDSRFLATGGIDGTARVWDLTDRRSSPAVIPAAVTEKGSSLRSMFRAWIVDLAFGDGDATLLTVGFDGTVRRWGLTELRLREEAERAVGRNMYEKDWCQYFTGWFRGSSRSYRATFEDLPLLQRNRTCPPEDAAKNSPSVRL